MTYGRQRATSFTAIDAVVSHERDSLENTVSGAKYSRSQVYPEWVSPLAQGDGDVCSLDYCVVQGRKATGEPCQDDLIITHYKKAQVFGLFDGHGTLGHEVSKACVYYLSRLEHFLLKPNKLGKAFISNTAATLPKVIKSLNRCIKDTVDLDAEDAGSTGTMAVILDKKLHISWVGDSKAIIFVSSHEDFSSLTSFEVTTDHNFSSSEEVERIMKAGGEIREGRLCDPSFGEESYPYLAMSKSLGDFACHKLGLNGDPDTVSIDFQQATNIGDLATQLGYSDVSSDFFERDIKHAVLVVASDGLWDVMTPRDVANFLKPRLLEKTEGSQMNVGANLVRKALSVATETSEGGRIDDISAIVSMLF